MPRMRPSLPPGPDQPPRRLRPPPIPVGFSGRWTRRPKLDPKRFRIVKTGGSRGVYTAKRIPPAPVAPRTTAPVAPTAPPDPYARYRAEAPWAVTGFEAIDRDQAAHQAYVTGQVMPWQSGALQGLQGFQDAAQSAYAGQVRGAVQGAYDVAAGMTPQTVPGAPGGIVAGPNAYLTAAGARFAGGMGSSLMQQAAHQGYLGKIQTGTLSQGAINATADYAKGLPLLYVERRREWTEKVEQFIAEQRQAQAELAERMRHNRVSEATSALNAQTNAAIQLGRLGLDADELALGNQPVAPPANLPPGFVAVPNDQGGYDVREDPGYVGPGGGGGGSQYPGGGTSTRDAQGRLRNPAEQGFTIGGWARKPKGIRLPMAQGVDGKWYAKPRAGRGGGGGGTAQVTPYGDLVADLGKKWNGTGSGPFGSGAPGWSETFRGDPAAIGQALAEWVIDNKDSFNTNSGRFDPQKLLRVLSTLGDGRKKYALVWAVIRGRIRNGRLA